jgi:tetratricopeptide (TPR) repeat protein
MAKTELPCGWISPIGRKRVKTVFRCLATIVALHGAGLAAGAAAGDPTLDCLSQDNALRISGCTALIETPGLPPEQMSLAHSMRALAYSLTGKLERAIQDYDEAILIKPDFPQALNNRAWTYFKLGRLSEGAGDVARALQLAPGSPAALDTRAHIRQAQGDAAAALADYEAAMRIGGAPTVQVYQCGLRSQGLYFGALDGHYSRSLKRALKTCVANPQCDPLPSDEDCNPTVS